MFYFFKEFDAIPEWVGKIKEGQGRLYFGCDVMVHKRKEMVEVYPFVEQYDQLFFVKKLTKYVSLEGNPTTCWPDVTYFFDNEKRKGTEIIEL